MAMEQFHWTSPDGVEVTLPKMGNLGAGMIRRHRKEEPVDFIFSVLEELDDPEMLSQVDLLSISQMNDLAAAWQADAEATPGE